MIIFCCYCKVYVDAELVYGDTIYPFRQDLCTLPFWKCRNCRNYVGCHHKTKNKTAPLGTIPFELLRIARRDIHLILDPMWKAGNITRSNLYKKLSKELGYVYHTTSINSMDEARRVYHIISKY